MGVVTGWEVRLGRPASDQHRGSWKLPDSGIPSLRSKSPGCPCVDMAWIAMRNLHGPGWVTSCLLLWICRAWSKKDYLEHLPEATLSPALHPHPQRCACPSPTPSSSLCRLLPPTLCLKGAKGATAELALQEEVTGRKKLKRKYLEQRWGSFRKRLGLGCWENLLASWKGSWHRGHRCEKEELRAEKVLPAASCPLNVLKSPQVRLLSTFGVMGDVGGGAGP